jgi:hypothetical protein
MSAASLIAEHRFVRRPSLVFDDAVEVWKRHDFLGESPQHIAQAFGVNLRHINEILHERRHVGSRLVASGTNPLGGERSH